MLIFAVLIISFGGAIRIHDAGESCPDWPKCLGLMALIYQRMSKLLIGKRIPMRLTQEDKIIDILCLRYS